MKINFIVLFFIIGAGLFAKSKVPHLEMEMSGEQYLSLIEKTDSWGIQNSKEDFKSILNTGKRFYEWLNLINKDRPEGKKLSLSSAATQIGYPIESPKFSNPTIIQTNFSKLKATAPEWMSGPLFNGTTLSSTCPVADDEFTTWGRKVTFVYEAASRWLLQEPYLEEYSARKENDIRGYYFLTKEKDLGDSFQNWKTLDASKRANLTEWLQGQCLNSGYTEKNCETEFKKAEPSYAGLLAFYSKYLNESQNLWNSFFKITSKRSDVDWTSAFPDSMKLPFQKPETSEIENFLTGNIEDEWRFGNWQLRLIYESPSKATAKIEFVAGATPHVNGLAGDIITMDANNPLTEYNTQWVIRHEFGHVIGLPDCYHEFYDKKSSTMISYQLDITNLMCSRRGHIHQEHVIELKRVYYK